MIFDFIKSFADMLEAIPPEHPRRRTLKLLNEAIRRDVNFIDRHPTLLFQCLWNTCWWYDCPEAAAHYVEPDGGWNKENAPWLVGKDEMLCRLLEHWREFRQQTNPNSFWLFSHRPPPMHLGTALRAVLRGHEDAVTSVSFSPDGRRIVSGSRDGTVRVWDAENGSEVLVLDLQSRNVMNVTFTTDGRRIKVTRSDDTNQLWDVDSGDELDSLPGPAEPISSESISPDGRRAARVVEWKRTADGGLHTTLRVYDIDSDDELPIVRGHSGEVTSACFSPDGQLIATGSCSMYRGSNDNTVDLWDIESLSQPNLLSGHEDRVTSVTYSPDGRRIASGSWDKTVRIWDSNNGNELAVFQGHEGPVTSVSFSPDGRRIASGSWDRTTREWDADNGDQLAVFTVQEGECAITAVCYSPDGDRIVAGVTDGTVRVWGDSAGIGVMASRHEGWVLSVSFSPDGKKIVSGSRDETVRLWDAEFGIERGIVGGHRNWVYGVSFSPDGQRIASTTRDETAQWDAETGQRLEVIRGFGDVRAIAAESTWGLKWRALARGQETVVEPVNGSNTVAEYPVALYSIATCPFGHEWAGAAGKHLYIITLKGEDQQ